MIDQTKKTIIGIIPARYGSSRFPGKPLAMIEGKTMIQRVYEQSLLSSHLAKVIVATDDERIFDHVKNFKGEVVMTSTSHNSGTERCAEVINKEGFDELYEAVINIQGDEPFINPRQIDQVAQLLGRTDVNIATLVKKITTNQEIFDPNVVKVILDHHKKALLFSRSPIPFNRNVPQNEWHLALKYFKHIGIYGYKSNVLKKIVTLPVSECEKAESLEQLRWLYFGYEINTEETLPDNIAIDTPGDLLKLTNKT